MALVRGAGKFPTEAMWWRGLSCLALAVLLLNAATFHAHDDAVASVEQKPEEGTATDAAATGGRWRSLMDSIFGGPAASSLEAAGTDDEDYQPWEDLNTGSEAGREKSGEEEGVEDGADEEEEEAGPDDEATGEGEEDEEEEGADGDEDGVVVVEDSDDTLLSDEATEGGEGEEEAYTPQEVDLTGELTAGASNEDQNGEGLYYTEEEPDVGSRRLQTAEDEEKKNPESHEPEDSTGARRLHDDTHHEPTSDHHHEPTSDHHQRDSRALHEEDDPKTPEQQPEPSRLLRQPRN